MANGNNWIRLGSTIINMDNMSYCELDTSNLGGQPTVRITFTACSEQWDQAISFSGEDYAPVRAYLERFFNAHMTGGIRLPSEKSSADGASADGEEA